jgi:hypothetical protein
MQYAPTNSTPRQPLPPFGVLSFTKGETYAQTILLYTNKACVTPPLCSSPLEKGVALCKHCVCTIGWFVLNSPLILRGVLRRREGLYKKYKRIGEVLI